MSQEAADSEDLQLSRNLAGNDSQERALGFAE